MQDKIELAKVKAFYYQKVVELGAPSQALKLIEFRRYDGDEWRSAYQLHPVTEFDVAWGHRTHEYRIKPETVIHMGGEYPKPLTMEDFERNEIKRFWVPSPENERLSKEIYGYDLKHHSYVKRLVSRGVAHLAESDAIAHAKVIYQIED